MHETRERRRKIRKFIRYELSIVINNQSHKSNWKKKYHIFIYRNFMHAACDWSRRQRRMTSTTCLSRHDVNISKLCKNENLQFSSSSSRCASADDARTRRNVVKEGEKGGEEEKKRKESRFFFYSLPTLTRLLYDDDEVKRIHEFRPQTIFPCLYVYFSLHLKNENSQRREKI